MDTENPTIKRLEDQISWYDKKCLFNKHWFYSLKIIEVFIAASIILLPSFDSPKIVISLTGVLIVLIESLQQLFQFQHNWITFRTTCENLKHEKYLWEAKAGPYSGQGDTSPTLADRIESLISQEHSKWIAGQEKVNQNKH